MNSSDVDNSTEDIFADLDGEIIEESPAVGDDEPEDTLVEE